MFTIYTKQNCPNCVTAKSLLHNWGLKYTEKSMDDPEVRQDFCARYPDVRQMPQVFADGQRLGGLAGLQAFLSR